MAYPTITTQPQAMAQPMNQRMWSSGTFGCFDDMGSCIIGALCPIVLACRVAGDLGESSCVPCCVPGSVIVMRTQMRTIQHPGKHHGRLRDGQLLRALYPLPDGPRNGLRQKGRHTVTCYVTTRVSHTSLKQRRTEAIRSLIMVLLYIMMN